MEVKLQQLDESWIHQIAEFPRHYLSPRRASGGKREAALPQWDQ